VGAEAVEPLGQGKSHAISTIYEFVVVF
jgi:hypothetical protein